MRPSFKDSRKRIYQKCGEKSPGTEKVYISHTEESAQPFDFTGIEPVLLRKLRYQSLQLQEVLHRPQWQQSFCESHERYSLNNLMYSWPPLPKSSIVSLLYCVCKKIAGRCQRPYIKQRYPQFGAFSNEVLSFSVQLPHS